MDRHPGRQEVKAVLTSLHGKGIRVWTANGQLQYQAPKGALTEPDVQTLRALKPQIVDYLETLGTTPAEPPIGARATRGAAPLTFAQLWDWNRWNAARPRYRTVYSATRLSGCLRVDRLRDCLNRLVQRHEALRTTFTSKDGAVTQIIAPTAPLGIDEVDLSRSEPSTHHEAI